MTSSLRYHSLPSRYSHLPIPELDLLDTQRKIFRAATLLADEINAGKYASPLTAAGRFARKSKAHAGVWQIVAKIDLDRRG